MKSFRAWCVLVVLATCCVANNGGQPTAHAGGMENLAHSLAAEKCAASGQVGTVALVAGGLQIEHAGHKRKARAGDPLYKGDTVTAEKGQRAYITMCSGASVYVDKQSRASMSGKADIKVQRGDVVERTNRSSQTVHTAEAVVRTKTGQFFVEAGKQNATVAVVSGSVEVQNRRGRVSVGANAETVVRANQAPAKPKAVDAQSITAWTQHVDNQWSVLLGSGVVAQPQGIAVDTSGAIYVSDVSGSDHRIVAAAANGKQTGIWHLDGNGVPMGLAVDTHRNLYATDVANSTVQVLSPQGQVTRVYHLTSLVSGAVLPTGLAVDRNGTMTIVDKAGSRLLRVSSDGQLQASWGSPGSAAGQFQSPQSVALDAAGTIYVADEFNDRIEKLSASGQYLASWRTGDYSSPTGVAADSTGNVWVVESNAGRVEEFSPSGARLWSWQAPPVDDRKAVGHFDRPYGIALDAHGNIYVTDRFGARVQKFSRG